MSGDYERLLDARRGIRLAIRFTTGGKQPAAVFHRGSLGEGMRAAIVECVDRYETMIEAWQR